MSIDIALYRSHFWETVSQQTSFYSDSYNLSPSFPLYFSSLTPTGKAYFSLLHTLQSWLWLDSSTIWSIRTGRPLEKVATCQFCIRDPGIADPSVERMCPWQSLPLGPGPSLRNHGAHLTLDLLQDHPDWPWETKLNMPNHSGKQESNA